jgi:hypothetical protein
MPATGNTHADDRRPWIPATHHEQSSKAASGTLLRLSGVNETMMCSPIKTAITISHQYFAVKRHRAELERGDVHPAGHGGVINFNSGSGQ